MGRHSLPWAAVFRAGANLDSLGWRRVLRVGLPALVLLLAVLTRPAYGATLEMRAGAGDFGVEPGRLVTRRILVENREGSEIEVSEELGLPSGWVAVPTGDPVFVLPSFAPRLRLLTFSIPAQAPSGPAKLRYVVRHRGNGQILLDREIPVEVIRTARLEVVWEEAPSSVVAGDPIPLAATLVNRGNSPLNVEVRTEVTPEVPNAPRRTLVVPPGSSQPLALEVATDASVTARKLSLIQVRLEAAPEGGTNLVLRPHSVTVDVLPRKAPAFDPYVRLPVRWTTRTAWETGRNPGVQTELAGRGALDETGKQRLDFVLRGPGAASRNDSLRTQDEYGATLASAALDVHLGDRRYAATPLLKNPSIDRGMGVDWRQGPLQAGGFVAQSRGEEPLREEQSAYLGWKPDSGPSVRYQALNIDRNLDRGRDPGRTLHSLVSSWELASGLSLELEGAMDPERDFGDGTAWRADVRGPLGERGGWHASRVEAGAGFGGAVRGSENSTLGAYVQLTEPLRLAVDWRDHRSEQPAEGKASPVKNHDTSWRAGPRYRFAEGPTVRLDLGGSVRERREEGLLTGARESSITAGVAYTLGSLDFDVSQEISQADGLGEGEPGGLISRSAISTLWRPGSGERQTYSATVQASTAEPGRGSGPTLLASLSGTWRIKPAVQTGLTASRRFDNDTSPGETSLMGRVDWTRQNRHELSAGVRVAKRDGATATEAAVSLAYRVPLSLPVGRRRGFGTIEGRVRDGDSPSGAGVERAVVRLNTGEVVATDRQGRFVFSGLKAGAYTASVDSRSLGFGRVSGSLSAPRLAVTDNTVTTVEILVVSAGTVEVRVTVFEETPAPAGVERGADGVDPHRPVGPLPGEVIEVTNGDETYRRLTDAAGLASFTALRPGRWSLRIYESALPVRHFAERPLREIEVPPRGKVSEEVRILPRKRRLKIIDSGG